MDNRLRLVFMARINRMKGLDILADVFSELDKMDLDLEMTFYGPIHEPDRQYFYENLIDRFSWVSYGGSLAPEHIVASLCKYDVMLFPTRYFTEGFPGSILDAYRAGIPVIATRWKYADEFIEDGVTGMIVDFDNPIAQFKEAIINMSLDHRYLQKLKQNALNKAATYSPDNAYRILQKYISQ